MRARSGNRDLKKRIRFIAGQLGGIEKMLEEGRDPDEIYVQLRSVAAAFHKSILHHFEVEHRNALGQAILEELDNCPGPCGRCKELEAVRKIYPSWDTKDVLNALRELKRKG